MILLDGACCSVCDSVIECHVCDSTCVYMCVCLSGLAFVSSMCVSVVVCHLSDSMIAFIWYFDIVYLMVGDSVSVYVSVRFWM